MHISDLQFKPKIIEDRINAIVKNEFPFAYDSKIKITSIDFSEKMEGPVWDEETRDAIGFPVKLVDFTIHCELKIRTDFEFENIVEGRKK